MFYSQFILAKKGPLGTIWIAAHLERKLRKNQVADTDIGISVDSILFPEAPIALRLSSHLLLGVVRIYSRKVNYLFHDCSEALLKIKQAFRSTAVDLPPEESTAPYHSITLPETFHLDDFELPDSIYGNFVDHHVSTKEQITLQDTLNTTGCSTSQFGLDERFGDGVASHIGLDLDEDLFLDKASSPRYALVPLGSEEDAFHQDIPSIPVTDMDVDHHQIMYDEDRDDATPKNFPEFISNGRHKHIHLDAENPKRNDDSFHQHGYNPQTPDLNEVFPPDIHAPLGVSVDDGASPDLTEFTHAPSTPGLTVEAIPVNFQEMPAFSPQDKMLPSTDMEPAKPDTSCCPHIKSADTAQAVCPPTIILTVQSGLMPASSDGHLEFGGRRADNSQDELHPNEKSNIQVPDQVLDNGEAILPEETREGLIYQSCPASNMGMHLDKGLDNPEQVVLTDICTGNKLVSEASSEINSTALNGKGEQLIPDNLKGVREAVFGPITDMLALNADCNLRSCNSQLNEAIVLSLQDRISENVPEASNGGLSCLTETPQREALEVAGSSIEVQDSPSAQVIDGDHGVHQKADNIFLGHKSGDGNPEEQSIVDVSKEAHMDHLNCSSSSEFPEPEKMVLAPAGDMNFSNEFRQLMTEKGVTESAGSVDRANKVSGRKRCLVEGTPILQNCSSAKLSGRPRFRRNNVYVPDDDDVLASILVGRRASSLRIGPTPPPLKVTSFKRPRLATKVGMPKRKVLLDDSMVLHADAIRQQLLNTEDIRRMRKKAPCTRPEIWMIEKCSREEEIFDESMLSGISAELYGVYTRSYALSENPDSQVEHQSHAKSSKEAELSRNSKIAGETYGKEWGEPVAAVSGEVHMQGTYGLVVSTQAHSCQDVITSDVQGQIKSQPTALELQISNNNECCAVPITEVDELHKENAGLGVSEFSSSHSANKIAIPADGVIADASTHKNNADDPFPEKSDGVCRKLDQQSAENLVKPSDELMEINDSTLQLCGTVPPEGSVSVQDAVRDRLVDDTRLPLESDKTLLRAEASCDAKGTSTMEESRDKILVEAVGNVENGGTVLDGSLLVQSLRPDVLMEVVQPAEMATTTDHQVTEQNREVWLDVAVNDEVVVEKLLTNVDGPLPETVCLERAQVAASCQIEHSTETENVPSAVGENSGMQEFHQEGGMDVESTSMDFSVARETSDFCSATEGNDKEFLNLDDEVDFDEGDIDVPNPEETQSFENSGWSSRTRGVARYLKSLFDNEYGHGRKVVTVDHLLAGKTRKEASRMFFETLVLKTRDYINVEQEKSFGYVKIKPRTKLLNSEF